MNFYRSLTVPASHRLSYFPVPSFAETRERTILLVPCFRCTRFLTKAGKEFLLKINPILREERESFLPFAEDSFPALAKKRTDLGQKRS